MQVQGDQDQLLQEVEVKKYNKKLIFWLVSWKIPQSCMPLAPRGFSFWYIKNQWISDFPRNRAKRFVKSGDIFRLNNNPRYPIPISMLLNIIFKKG